MKLNTLLVSAVFALVGATAMAEGAAEAPKATDAPAMEKSADKAPAVKAEKTAKKGKKMKKAKDAK